MRACKYCLKSLPASAFYDPETATGRSAGKSCKACWVAKSIAWRTANRDKWNATRRRAGIARFGLTEAAYDAILASQGGGCAGCGSTGSNERSCTSRRLCVDHDHVTGRVRGLLCRECNLAIKGSMTAETLIRLAEYLRNPPAEAVA